MTELREFLCANMMDGSDEGLFTMKAAELLDEVCELVDAYLDDHNGKLGHE